MGGTVGRGRNIREPVGVADCPDLLTSNRIERVGAKRPNADDLDLTGYFNKERCRVGLRDRVVAGRLPAHLSGLGIKRHDERLVVPITAQNEQVSKEDG